MNARGKDDITHDIDGYPGDNVREPHGKRLGLAANNHEKRQRRSTERWSPHGTRRRANLLGYVGASHLQIFDVLCLRARGKVHTESDQRLRLRSRELVSIQKALCHTENSAVEAKLSQEYLRLRHQRRFAGLPKYS